MLPPGGSMCGILRFASGLPPGWRGMLEERASELRSEGLTLPGSGGDNDTAETDEDDRCGGAPFQLPPPPSSVAPDPSKLPSDPPSCPPRWSAPPAPWSGRGEKGAASGVGAPPDGSIGADNSACGALMSATGSSLRPRRSGNGNAHPSKMAVLKNRGQVMSRG